MGPTRTEADFLNHVKATVDSIPAASGWVFVLDQLNTHMSASLVKYVAEFEGISPTELGVKGRNGILKSKKTRREFLEITTHKIRFVFTPRHASWLNRIENWFGVISRKLLKRSSFKSVAHLMEMIADFNEYYNRTMAKPYKP